jgi:sarcosine oxidase
MIKRYENVVIGMGGIGSATAYWMAREGSGSVLGLEQFELGHPRGESDDHSRIIRLSYHDPKYTALTPNAYEAWREVEKASGTRLVVQTGGLDLDSDLDYLQGVASSMDKANISYDRLEPGEVMKRWPQFKLPKDMACLYQEASGLVDARKAITTHAKLASDLGATILPNTRVESIELHDGGSAVVKTSNGDFEAGKLVIAGGPWSAKLMKSVGIDLNLQVTKEQVVYYRPEEPGKFSTENFPIWLLHYHDSERYYGFPVYGEPATKAGIHMGGKEVDPDTRDFEPDPRITKSLNDMLGDFIPEFIGPIHYEKTCLYTLTPDRDFIVDTLPNNPNVAVFVGAGHAYKFASSLGRTLNQIVTSGTIPQSMSAFRLDRPALTDPNYAPADPHFGTPVSKTD